MLLNSWIGSGANQPISADQLSGALGADVLAKVAGPLGLDASQLSGQLAQVLPGLVDQLTPNGRAPAAGLGDSG